MTEKARRLARRLARGGRFTVRITKRDGSERQMRFEIKPHATIRFSAKDGGPMVSVDDLDRRAPRWLRLDAVHQLTEAPRPVRTLPEMKALTDSLF